MGNTLYTPVGNHSSSRSMGLQKKVIGLFAIFATVVFVSHLSKNGKGIPMDDSGIEGDTDVMPGRGSGSHNNFHIMPDYENAPSIEMTDIIYKSGRHTIPIVNTEYKTVFFLVAKAASSEWLRFFYRLNKSQIWCESHTHDRMHEGLDMLSDFSIEEATEMMTSPEWTRAIFVRNPKPRILSAFLDKAVQHDESFVRDKCPNYERLGGDLQECIERHTDFSFFLQNIVPTMHDNVHWRSVYSRVDEKWWPWINYVANMEHLDQDAEHFLKSIKSSVDGVTAWDRIGKTGWGENERDCDHLGGSAFLQKKDERHHTDARTKLRNYYTPELEKFVEIHFADDYNNPYFQFSDLKLFEVEDENVDAEDE